jgi:uncharacterized protein
MSQPTPKPTPRCPVCGKPRDARFRPFCSRRCRDVDLGRWFNQAYAIPVAPSGDEEEVEVEGEGEGEAQEDR